MTSHHTHLTPDLPPIVDVPDLPGAEHAGHGRRPAGGDAASGDGDGSEPVSPPGRGSGAHQEDGRHGRAGEGSGG